MWIDSLWFDKSWEALRGNELGIPSELLSVILAAGNDQGSRTWLSALWLFPPLIPVRFYCSRSRPHRPQVIPQPQFFCLHCGVWEMCEVVIPANCPFIDRDVRIIWSKLAFKGTAFLHCHHWIFNVASTLCSTFLYSSTGSADWGTRYLTFIIVSYCSCTQTRMPLTSLGLATDAER